MLRELITWVLNTYLGKYLEDFNPAQLTVALLSGEVELENVPLRRDALRGLGLPLQALSGNIGKIKLQVPVRQFRSAPWCVIIEKVYVVISPIDLDEWDDEKERLADLSYKLTQLDDIEAKWRTKREAYLESGYYTSSYSGWLNYGTSLATNIIENLQLKINDVHIRYEDPITIAKTQFACGIKIESLSAQSCDSNWNPGFTSSWNQNSSSFKLLELKSFAVYWDRLSPSEILGVTPSGELAEAMEKLNKEHKYVIHPISLQARFKRDRSETPLRTRSRPRLSCEVIVNEISLSLSDHQYHEIIECIRGINTINKLRKYRLLRPKIEVTKNPKLWWRYAAKCHGYSFKTFEEKRTKYKDNLRYLQIYSKVVLNPNEILTPDTKEFKSNIEKHRDLDELRTLREICLQQTPLDDKLKDQKTNQGRNMLFQWFPQWWGWYGSNNSAETVAAENSNNATPTSENNNFDDDELLNVLADSVDNDSVLKRDSVFGKFNFELKSGLMLLCSEKLTTKEIYTLLEFHFDSLLLNIETRPRSGSHLVGLSLGSVCIKDRITPNTEFPDLMKPQIKYNVASSTRLQSHKQQREINYDSAEPWFQLQYERKPLSYTADYRLEIRTKSLDVVYNIVALRCLIDFVSKPLRMLSAKKKIEAMKNKTKMRLINNWKNIGQRKSWSLEIDVHAPQIIFVENFSNENTTVVLFDFGRFKLRKNAIKDRIKQSDSFRPNDMSSCSNLSNKGSEDEDMFMTPCSTPPGSEASVSDSPTLHSTVADMQDLNSDMNTGLGDALYMKIYDKYIIDLTDLQVLVCKGKERLAFASSKGTSALHVLDRFNISLQLERRVFHTDDPNYPSVQLQGTLPKLVAHVNEQKILALSNILDIMSTEILQTAATMPPANKSFADLTSDTISEGGESTSFDENTELTDDDTDGNLIVIKFDVDQMSLEVQSRGRSIAELQVTGVKAAFTKRPGKTDVLLSVHGLLLVDAIQSFGRDFELLVASHRYVGMDSVSGSLKQSEPCSPISPPSPDPIQDRCTSPQTITRALSSLQKDKLLQKSNSLTWSTSGDLDALITIEISFEDKLEKSRTATIHFNNLDIIANQETIVELLGFIRRVLPTNDIKPKRENAVMEIDDKELLDSAPIHTEIKFNFHRLNVLILRALMRDAFLIGRKVGTFTMSEAKIHASLGSEIIVDGSLGGLQVLDLTPEGINHQRILSVGKDPLTETDGNEHDLVSFLTEEIYGPSQSKNKMMNQRQALSFRISKDIKATVNIKIRMASVWYTHCARFTQELNWCATEFKHYLKNLAKSIRDKATDMAYGLVQYYDEHLDSNILLKSTESKFSIGPPTRQKKKKKNDIRLDIVLDTPVLVVPRSSNSSEVLVAHLGKISISNSHQLQAESDEMRTIEEEKSPQFSSVDDFLEDASLDQENVGPYPNNCDNILENNDVYSIDIRNMNLFSLDTSSRKGFRMTDLPKAEEFYSCNEEAVAILHDTAIGLQITKFSKDINQTSAAKEILQVSGSVTQPLQISLSRGQYEQVLETIDNIFTIPSDMVYPPKVVNTYLDHNDVVDKSDFVVAAVVSDAVKIPEKRKSLEPQVSFSLPIFKIQLKDEHNKPLIEITFREFGVNYEKDNLYETNIQVSLRSILMEDLLCPIGSKYRQMVVSSQQNPAMSNEFSSSCPNLSRLYDNQESITGSLPENLEAGFENFYWKNSSRRTESFKPKPILDNLVIYSALLIDPNCSEFATKYNSLRQRSSIDFNSLDLIISVESWFLLLNFFGLMSEDEEPDTISGSKREKREKEIVKENFNGNTKLDISVRSLTLKLVRNGFELAKANVSNANFTVSKQDYSKTTEGRLGSVSLVDLTTSGGMYSERFWTCGSEALKFTYKREGEKNKQRSLNKDAILKIQMSSVSFVYTKRFIMEIQAFIKEFLQLQTPVIRKIKSTESHSNFHQRPTQLGLEIKAGSPIILLPLSTKSNQVIIVDLGELTLRNSFHLASESNIISKKRDTTLLDEIIDVMEVDLVNTDLFTGTTWSKSRDPPKPESGIQICVDMGNYWIIKKGRSMLNEKCHLKLQVERNMDSWKSHNCPDFSVQGTLSRLEGILDLEQYKLIKGFLSFNLGETIDDIYENAFMLTESRINLTIIDEKQIEKSVWTNMSVNLDLEDVSLLLKWSSEESNRDNQQSQSLACINFIKSSLKIDSFSDGSQDIDLISQEILITDSRNKNVSAAPKNVFTKILKPIYKNSGDLVQAEVHSRKRNDCTKYTILLNNMRIMAILDWLENVQDFLGRNPELSKGSYYNSSHVTDISSSTTALDREPIELILNITDSELVLVEKTDQFDTNAVILKSTTVVSFKPNETIKPMSVNLNHLEVFSCILGNEKDTALSIIDPITVNADVKEHVLQIQLQKQLCIRLSYHDVKMFTRMLKSLPKQTRTAQTTKNKKQLEESEIKRHHVLKLVTLGFKESDCVNALKNCPNLYDAALWLTQNAEPIRNYVNSSSANKGAGLDIHAVEIHAHCISICVIDDCKDSDVPLLELSFSQIDCKQDLNISMFNSAQSSSTAIPAFCNGFLKATVASDYYNRHLSGWEPIIEPWKCDITWDYKLGRNGIERSLRINSEELLKLNITSTLIELWSIVQTNWTQDYYVNTTGYRRRNPFIPFSLENQTGVKIRFKIIMSSTGGITRTEVSIDRARRQWVIVEPNKKEPVFFGEQSKLRHLDSHKLNLHQIVVCADGWTEVAPVSIDKVGTFFRHSQRDPTGEYPTMPKARIVFAVTLEGSAQKLVTIRSALRVFNNLDSAIALKMDYLNRQMGISNWPATENTIIEAGQKYSVPLNYVYSSLYFQPNIPDELSQIQQSELVKSCLNVMDVDRKQLMKPKCEFQFCDSLKSWQECNSNNNGQEYYKELQTCKGIRDKVYNAVVIHRREGYPIRSDSNIYPGHSIILQPPLKINNLLCCDLLYKLKQGKIQGRIQSSNSATVFEIDLTQELQLNFRLDGYNSSGEIIIPEGFNGIKDYILPLRDHKDRELQLRAQIQLIKSSGLEISIYAQYWLVNRTGLPLIYRQDGVAKEASGQFDENEEARLVTPHMFSFSDPDASSALVVRLGKRTRYGSSPQWCQPLSLHKDIVNRELKTENTNETFFIGIEIRKGRGRYSRTSVVTFSPRFRLYNRSSHKLQFTQQCYAIAVTDLYAKSSIIEAVPGCHLPFHWPKNDKIHLLCVRLSDVENCCWSEGIPIVKAQSIYINVRNVNGDMNFLRLEIILQGATYFLLFGDAQSLPPPIRLDNYSQVPIKFYQTGCKERRETTVKPNSSISYALDNPTGAQSLYVEAPGGVWCDCSLKDFEKQHNLTYDNFIYIAFKETFESPMSSFDMDSQHLVLGVKDFRVVLMRKERGDRSQLWRMNQQKQIEHEGSSPPTEPGKKPSNLSPRYVLDIDKPPRPMVSSCLIIRPANKQRKSTQTWRFTEDGRLMCEHANMCVQAYNGVFGLRPGCTAVLGMIQSDSHTFSYSQSNVPVDQAIERQKLRPGSGFLAVSMTMDGPTKAIQIVDVSNKENIQLKSDPVWKHASHVMIPDTTASSQTIEVVEEYNVSVRLKRGLGISVISKIPCEELAYITLENIALKATATPSTRSIDFTVGDIQIDNQLLETQCPVLLYTMKQNYKGADFSALQLSAKMLPSPNTNAIIYDKFVVTLHKTFVLYLEERLLLRLAIFFSLGRSQYDETNLSDESDFEAQQVATKILSANAKRYYFNNLQILNCEARLSVITSSKLSPKLVDIKKKLGLTLIKFEDATIEFGEFTYRHQFETLELYLRAIKTHYKNELKWQAASILGSVDFLGNPLGFANDLSEGVSGLIFEGSVRSLVKNVTHGISNSTAKLTETLSDGLGRVVLDEHDNETRQRILEVSTSGNSSGEHLAAGLKGFGFGLLGGVTSIVKHTYEGAQNDGFQGFISGLGKGIIGTVTKPIIGVLDLASETASAVRETSKSAHRILPERKRLPRCISGAPGGLLPAYSVTQSKGQQHMFLINKRNFNEQLLSYEPNLWETGDSKLRLLVSSENVWVFSRTYDTTTIILSYHLSEVVSCHPVTANTNSEGKKLKNVSFYIELSTTKSNVTSSGSLEVLKRPRVRCRTAEMAEKASRHINYAKGVYDEREHTLSPDLLTD